MARGAHHRTAEGVGSDFSPSIARKDRSFETQQLPVRRTSLLPGGSTKQPTQTGRTGAQAGAGVQCQGVGAKGQRIARLRHRAIRGVILVKPECDFVKISQ